MTLWSCQDEIVDHSFIKDKWMITEAYRGGSYTTTLEDGFFHLTTDSTFTTNIFGSESTFPMEINDMGWLQSQPEEIQYGVEVLHDDTLLINTEIRDLEFRFTVARDTTSVVR